MKDEKQYYVYILASGKNGTLYIGITSDLLNRIFKHREGIFEGFTKKYKVDNLVYYEIYGEVYEAIIREKRLKKWKREWKIKLIEEFNPSGKDLYKDLF